MIFLVRSDRSCNSLRKRVASFAAVLFFVLAWTPVVGQENGSQRMILVAVPKRMDLQSEAVERLVKQAKSYRAGRNESVNSWPIVRLSNGLEAHLKVLQELGLSKLDDPVVYMCSRGPRGWPTALLKPLTLAPQGVSPGPRAIDRDSQESKRGPQASGQSPKPSDIENAEATVKKSSPPELSADLELGYLLYYRTGDAAASAQVKSLVKELGRFWLERYGRARPAPFPLAFYDASSPLVKARVHSRWPEMGDGSQPVLFLVSYQQKRPESVLARVEDLDLPAQAIRSAAALRRRWQNRVQLTPNSPNAQDTPLPEAVPLDDGEETYLLVLRIRELAQQLWLSSEGGPQLSPESKRRLIAVSELCRKYLDGDEERLAAIREALADLEELDLDRPSPSARLRTVWSRLRSLSKQLLQRQ